MFARPRAHESLTRTGDSVAATATTSRQVVIVPGKGKQTDGTWRKGEGKRGEKISFA